MGSFDFTCTVSGLPIGCGDKVRYFLLTKNPYGDSRGCSMHDQWFPRCVPLRAEYNDYGTVQAVEEGYGQTLWLEGLKRDLIETGWGDNSAHDLPTTKTLSFEELLDAVSEGRIRVQRKAPHPLDKKAKLFGVDPFEKIRKHFPTLQSILAVFAEKEIPLYEGMGKKGGYMVDEVHGVVRIRFQDWEKNHGKDTEFLTKIQPVLKDYATVITAGTGSYAHESELLVMVKPNSDHAQNSLGTPPPDGGLPVSHAMIREDVWQALLQLKVETSGPDYKYMHVGFDYFKNLGEKFLPESAKLVREDRLHLDDIREILNKGNKETAISEEEREESLEAKLYLNCMRAEENAISGWLSKDTLPYTVGLGTNFRILLKDYLAEKVTESQATTWMEAATEFVFISKVLMTSRYCWKPSYSSGPQFGEFRFHQEVNQAFADIAKQHADAQEKDRG